MNPKDLLAEIQVVKQELMTEPTAGDVHRTVFIHQHAPLALMAMELLLKEVVEHDERVNPIS